MKKLWSVLTDDLEHCMITGSPYVAIHHVFGASERILSEKYGFLIPLRPDWHTDTKYCIHNDKLLREHYRRQAQVYYEKHYGNREDFIKEFKKSYL